jgi:hypothetical protein
VISGVLIGFGAVFSLMTVLLHYMHGKMSGEKESTDTFL